MSEAKPIFIDDGENADWVRAMTWDLPEDADEFLEIVRPEKLKHFMRTPAARPMPHPLRLELHRRGLL
jgi:hypothetical protein